MADSWEKKKRQQAVPRGQLNKLNQHDLRSKIKVAMLLKRLADHVDGIAELTQTQLRAAEILLRKSMPDLSAATVEHSGTIGVAQELAGLNRAYEVIEQAPEQPTIQ